MTHSAPKLPFNRLGSLFLLFAIVLAVVLGVVVLTLEKDTVRASAVELVSDQFHDAKVEVSGGTLTFRDERTNAKLWQLEAAHVALGGLEKASIASLGAMEVSGPELTLFSQDATGGEQIAASVSAEIGIVDPSTQHAELLGRIHMVLDPDGDRIDIRLRGPLAIQIDREPEGGTNSVRAHSESEVTVRNRRLELTGTGFVLDMDQGFASLATNVHALIRMEGTGGIPGRGQGTLSVSCDGPAICRRHGGDEGIVPSVTLQDRVRIVADDGTLLDCDQLSISSAPGAPGFLPSRVHAQGHAHVSMPGIGEITGEELIATRGGDGAWSTEVVAGDEGRLAGSLEVGKTEVGSRRLEFSCAGKMTFVQESNQAGVLVFADDIRGQLVTAASGLTAGEPPRLTAADELRVFLNAGDGAATVAGIQRIVASGAVTLEDPSGAAIELARDGGGYGSLSASATRRMEATLDEAGELGEIILDGEAAITLTGVEGAWVRGEGAPAGEEAVDLSAHASSLTLTRSEDGLYSVSSTGDTMLEEKDAQGALRRRLECSVDSAAQHPGVTGELHARAEGDPVRFVDETFDPPIYAEGTSVEIAGGEMLTLRGSPAIARAGEDSISGTVLILDRAANRLDAPEDPLSITILREGADRPIVATGHSIQRLENGSYALEGDADQRASASGVDGTASFELHAPRIEIDPETTRASCPRGGELAVARAMAQNPGVTERANIDSKGPLRYDPTTQEVTASGGMHLVAVRSDRPFEIRADQATAHLMTAPGKSGLTLREVVATGHLFMVSGPYEATGGRELRWNAVAQTATIQREGNNLLTFTDTKSRMRFRTREVTFYEGRDGGQGQGFKAQGFQVDGVGRPSPGRPK